MVSTAFQIADANEKPPKPADAAPAKNAFQAGYGKRHLLILLAFIGIFNIYTVRICLSIAIVAMVLPTSVNLNKTLSDNATSSPDTCPVPDAFGEGTVVEPTNSPRYSWNSEVQGFVQSAYFYGYICTQVAGGWLAKHIGGKYPFGLGVLFAGLMTLLSPVAANYHYGALIAVRILEGLSTGVCYPALQQLLSKWCPVAERARLSTMVNAGAPIGNVVVLIVSGFIGDYLGWEAIFYTFGGITCFWYLFWQFFIYNSPDDHPTISQREMMLITGREKVKALADEKKVKPFQPPVPWRRILTSGAMWAMCFAHFGQNWGNYTLLTNLPNYMKNILRFELSANGIFSALPHLALWIIQIGGGWLCDYMCHRKVMSKTKIRKFFNTVGNIVPIGALIAVGYIGCDWIAAIALLTLGTGISAFTQSAYPLTSLDIAPAFASITFGLSNTISNVPGIVSPYTVGLLTAGPNGQTLFNWRIIFFISAGVRIVTTSVYAIFASAEPADWNYTPPKTETESKDRRLDEDVEKL